jgi:hypothetical protein
VRLEQAERRAARHEQADNERDARGAEVLDLEMPFPTLLNRLA